MFRIAVCDDEVTLSSWIEKIILQYEKSKLEVFQVDVYYTGEELCNYLESGVYYDLIFLDIELKLLNGIEVGKKIRDELKNEGTQIVYISAKNSYAMELFKVRPMDFLIKPLKPVYLEETVMKAMELSERTSKLFQYKQGHELHKIQVKEILYFRSLNREIRMVTKNSNIEFYGTLEKIFEELEKYRFFYCHKSYLVNYNHIINFEYTKLTMSNQEVIPISQPKRKLIRDMQKELEIIDL